MRKAGDAARHERNFRVGEQDAGFLEILRSDRPWYLPAIAGYCLGRIPLWRGEFHASSSFGAVADGGGGCVCRARARCGNGAPLRCHSRYPAPREYTDPPGRLVAPSYSDESSSQVTFETSCRPMTADHATADCGCFLAWAASTSLRSKKEITGQRFSMFSRPPCSCRSTSRFDIGRRVEAAPVAARQQRDGEY